MQIKIKFPVDNINISFSKYQEKLYILNKIKGN